MNLICTEYIRESQRLHFAVMLTSTVSVAGSGFCMKQIPVSSLARGVSHLALAAAAAPALPI